MKFLLVAPFRTRLNLKTSHAATQTRLSAEHLAELRNALSSRVSSKIQVTTPRLLHASNTLKYATLSEDSLPEFAKPVLRLHLLEGALQLERNIETLPPESIQVGACTLEIYDNTIGVFQARVRVNLGKHHEKEIGTTLDSILTRVCTDLLSALTESLTEIDAIAQGHASKNKSSIFLHADDYEIFFDQQDGQHGTRFEPLWVTRILLNCGDNLDNAFLHDWVQCDLETARPISLSKSEARFFIGNSFVRGHLSEAEETSLMNSLSFCTYFYTLYDTINSNLSTLLKRAGDRRVRKLVFQKKMSRIRGHIQHIELEFQDVMLGLQGHRKTFSKELLHVWEYEHLAQAVQMKKAALANQIEDYVRDRQVRNARFIEMFLAAIGGVALFDFCINLYAFVREDSHTPDSVPGITDWPLVISVDSTMYILIALLAVLLIKIIRNK